MSVEWRDHLAVGVQSIDDQHKELFRRFNALMTAIAHGKGPLKVIETLSFLDDYTANHFRDEEKIQEDHNYPHRGMHHEEHEQFRRDLIRLKGRITEDGFTQQNVLLTSRTLLRWLIQHICNTDKALADFINGKSRRVISVPQQMIATRPQPVAPVVETDPDEKIFPFYYEDDNLV